MSVHGLFAKFKKKEIKYARAIMLSTTTTTKESVSQCHQRCTLLDEHVTANILKLQRTSSYPGTLCLTEDRQYRCRGLTHIEEGYEFFLELEALQVEHMNHKKLQVHREDLIDRALDIINKNEPLRAKWKSCFPEEENDTSKVNEALSLYIQLSRNRIQ